MPILLGLLLLGFLGALLVPAGLPGFLQDRSPVSGISWGLVPTLLTLLLVTRRAAPMRRLAVLIWSVVALLMLWSWPGLATGDPILQLRTTQPDLLLALPLCTALGIGLWWICHDLASPEPVWELRLTLGTAGLLGIALILLGLERHHQFHSNAYDLGIFTNLFWNLTHGHGLQVPVRGLDTILADHAAPTWWLCAPLFALFGGTASSLILMQGLALISAGWPLWLIARARLGDPLAAARIVLAYALFAPLHWFALFDVHEVALAIPLTLALLWCWQTQRTGWFWVWAVLLIGVKEELGIVAGTLGLVLAWRGDRRQGLGLAVLGNGWFLLYAGVIQPALRAEGNYYYAHRYPYLGDSLGAILLSLITRPDLWLPRFLTLRPWFFAGLLLVPLAGLPLRGWPWLVVLIPTFLYSVLSVEPLQTSIYAQYTAPYIPFLFFALIEGCRVVTAEATPDLQIGRSRSMLACCCALFTAAVLSPMAFSRADLRPYIQPSNSDRFLAALLDPHVTSTDAISASSRFVPHLAAREVVLRFPAIAWQETAVPYVLLDLGADTLPAELARSYRIVAQEGALVLYRRQASVNAIPLPEAPTGPFVQLEESLPWTPRAGIAIYAGAFEPHRLVGTLPVTLTPETWVAEHGYELRPDPYYCPGWNPAQWPPDTAIFLHPYILPAGWHLSAAEYLLEHPPLGPPIPMRAVDWHASSIPTTLQTP